jgi:hypothetical protein
VKEINNLFQEARDVPLPVEPLYWDVRLPVAANVNTVSKYIADYTKMLPGGCAIDEAAIMVPRGEQFLDRMSSHLNSGGWYQFNSAVDLVAANPFGTRYVVQYHFFSNNRYPWRLEVMQMAKARDGRTGFSPLHQALWYPSGEEPGWSDGASLPVPHLSFKPLIGKEGPRKAVRKAMDVIKFGGAILVQSCQSTYGEFFYLLPVNARRQLYIKPRINLRDAALEASL